MGNKGWIKLHRGLEDKPVWFDSTAEQKAILITILLEVNYKPCSWSFKGKPYKCEAGQMITSVDNLASMSGKGITSSKVRTALKKFEKLGFLTSETSNKNTLITVVNWELYQKDDDCVSKQTDNEIANSSQTNDKQIATIKKIKNVKNERKTYSVDFEALWEIYPRKKEKAKAYKCYCARLKDGYSEEEIKTAAMLYAQECQDRKTDDKYIKLCATFLGANMPFVDYITKENKKNEDTCRRGQASDYYRKYGI